VGAEHREVIVSPAEFFEALPLLVWHEDEPIAFSSSVPLYFVSRLAAQHVKVVLTGEGADELFLGYNRYRVTAWNERLAGAYGAARPRAAAGSGAAARHTAAAASAALRRAQFPRARGQPPRAVLRELRRVPESLLRRVMADDALLAGRDPYAEALRCAAEGPERSPDWMSHADLQTYLVELLMKQDQMSMAASVESRVPFLDHELVEHVVGMPARFKLRGWRTKAVLRDAVRDLVPREILRRPKMGFPVPVGRWLRGPFWPLVEEFVLGRARSRAACSIPRRSSAWPTSIVAARARTAIVSGSS